MYEASRTYTTWKIPTKADKNVVERIAPVRAYQQVRVGASINWDKIYTTSARVLFMKLWSARGLKRTTFIATLFLYFLGNSITYPQHKICAGSRITVQNTKQKWLFSYNGPIMSKSDSAASISSSHQKWNKNRQLILIFQIETTSFSKISCILFFLYRPPNTFRYYRLLPFLLSQVSSHVPGRNQFSRKL